MAYAAPRTWVAGEVNTAAQFNQDVRDNFSALLNKPRSRVVNSAAQSPATATNVDCIYDTTIYDNDSMVTGSPSLTINTTGLYFLTNRIQYASNATGRRILYLGVNGASLVRAESSPAFASAWGASNGYFAYCVATDTIKGITFQTSGAGLSTSSPGNNDGIVSGYAMAVNWISG
jgi:hypothetical protein